MGYIPRSATDIRYVEAAGDTMTGDFTIASNLLTIDSIATASLIADKGTAANYAQFEFRTAGTQNFAIGTNPSGQLYCYATQADLQPFSISPTDGRMVVVADPTAALGVSTKQYTDTKWTMWTGTQAAYDAIGTKDPSTLYVIV